jgi:hypothetical protein
MEEREEKRGGAGCAIAGVALIFLLVLYVFGLGPAVWVATRYPSTIDAISIVYYPLEFLAENSEPIARPLRWYADFWH